MRTFLSDEFRSTSEGREANDILRTCVHCGFCNATCPTYDLLGDERDGPRGRIYLIKEMLENGAAGRETQQHLDRCLTCRSCETTCPSGVQYNRLLEIGRAVAEENIRRPLFERIQQKALLFTVPEPRRLRPLLRLARWFRPLLPAGQRRLVSMDIPNAESWPANEHPRSVLLLDGCAQSVLAPRINLAAARVLDRLGVRALPGPGCCGALAHHLSEEERTLKTIRGNIDRWWPAVENGVEAVILTASGCAPTVRDYGRLLRDDADYAERAERLASLAVEISEYLERQDLAPLADAVPPGPPVAYHSPCTMQHGLKRAGRVEALLARLGFSLAPVTDAHLCCGSAGSYSILQKELSQRLLARKLETLEREQPAVIATANIGCLMHLQSGTERPVRHWIELLISCPE